MELSSKHHYAGDTWYSQKKLTELGTTFVLFFPYSLDVLTVVYGKPVLFVWKKFYYHFFNAEQVQRQYGWIDISGMEQY